MGREDEFAFDERGEEDGDDDDGDLFEEGAPAAGHDEEREEGDDDGEDPKGDWGGDVERAFDGGVFWGFAEFGVTVDRFADDDGVVCDDAHDDDEAEEAEHVDGEAEVVHHDEATGEGDGDAEDDPEGEGDAEEEGEGDEDEGTALETVPEEVGETFADRAGVIAPETEFDAGGETVAGGFDPFLDGIGDG